MDNGNQNNIDELFKAQIRKTHRQRKTRRAALLIVCVSLIVCVGLVYGVNGIIRDSKLFRNKDIAVVNTSPVVTDMVPSGSPVPSISFDIKNETVTDDSIESKSIIPEKSLFPNQDTSEKSADISEDSKQAENKKKNHILTLNKDEIDDIKSLGVKIYANDAVIHEGILSDSNNWTIEWTDEYPNYKLTILPELPEESVVYFSYNGEKINICLAKDNTGNHEVDTDDPIESDETEKEATSKTDGKTLPQTGVDYKSELILLVIGLLLVSLGIGMRYKENNEEEAY